VVVAATVPVVVYGLIQVHDYVLDKHSPWDFVQWHHAYVNVFTTLGNPNHLAGFLVTILPIGVVTAVLARHRWVRIALWVWVAVVAALVLQTDARGAWLGTLASGAILVVGMLPRLRANVRTVAIAVGGGLVIAVALIASGSRFLGAKAAALFQFGPGSSVSQRYGYWSAAIRIGVHHPLVGTGPDTYAVSYARYQDAALAKLLGSTYFVNGAHNIFLAWLANEGFPGFLLIVALFALGIAWGVRAWATLGKKSSDPETSEAPERGPAELRRYMVAALVAGLVAYFVQASFDVDQVATLFAMFLVLGLLGVVNRGVWPLPTLVAPFSAFRGAKTEGDMQRAEEDSDYPAHITRGGVYGRSASAARRRLQRATTAFAVGAVGLTAVGLTFWRTDAMWRADHEAWVGTEASVEQAITLNPWEPSYDMRLGQAAESSYQHEPTSSQAAPLLEAAVGFLRHEVDLDGADTYAQTDYAGALEALGNLQHSSSLFRMSLAALHTAKQEDPFNTSVAPLIKADEKGLGSS
jgi:O-antigen ligase